jgi:hypothetical protein
MRQGSPREQHDEEPFRWHFPRHWKPHTPQILSVKALSLTPVGLDVVAEGAHRSTKLKSLKDVETLARFVFDGRPPICACTFYDLRPKWEKLYFDERSSTYFGN